MHNREFLKGILTMVGSRMSMNFANNWRAAWKNRICSTTMKLRKSLVKPVMWQKTCNYNVLFSSYTRDRHAWLTHISTDVQGITLNASCLTISGRRTEQLDIFCYVTGFTSDFLSFIVMEHIWFFHGALQLYQVLRFFRPRSLYLGCKNRTTYYNRFWRLAAVE